MWIIATLGYIAKLTKTINIKIDSSLGSPEVFETSNKTPGLDMTNLIIVLKLKQIEVSKLQDLKLFFDILVTNGSRSQIIFEILVTNGLGSQSILRS